MIVGVDFVQALTPFLLYLQILLYETQNQQNPQVSYTALTKICQSLKLVRRNAIQQGRRQKYCPWNKERNVEKLLFECGENCPFL